MKKDDILGILKYEGSDDSGDCICDAVNRITDTLSAIPEEVDLGNMESVENFKQSGMFGICNFPKSRESANEYENERTRILSDLQCIRTELATWIRNNKSFLQYCYSVTLHSKYRKRRIGIIVALGLIAISAVILSILKWCGKGIIIGSTEIDVGELVGLIDLVVGIGFGIYELIDDARITKGCEAIEDMYKSTDETGVIDECKFKRAANRCKIYKRTIIVHIFSHMFNNWFQINIHHDNDEEDDDD